MSAYYFGLSVMLGNDAIERAENVKTWCIPMSNQRKDQCICRGTQKCIIAI